MANLYLVDSPIDISAGTTTSCNHTRDSQALMKGAEVLPQERTQRRGQATTTPTENLETTVRVCTPS